MFDLKQAHTYAPPNAAAADFIDAPPASTFRAGAPPPPPPPQTLNLRRAAADQMMPAQGSNSNCITHGFEVKQHDWISLNTVLAVANL